ncbi:MAG: carbamoyltransferase family protein [Planctomycetota bacterium]|jgi:carbamoyltransferase
MELQLETRKAKPYTELMYILGLTHPMAWNNAAALMRDGEVLLFVEEERLNRFKQSHGIAPNMALQSCLDEAGITLDEVDHIGVGWDARTRQKRKDKMVWDYQFKQLPIDPEDPRIRYLRHHLTHVLSAFDPSPFEEAAVLSWDGTGESESALLCRASDSKIDILASVPRGESWGYLFGKMTEKLGFVGHRDEGKVMGLASYGSADPGRFDFIDWRREIPRITKKKLKRFLSRIPVRAPSEEIRTEHMDLAATLQDVLQRALIAMARWLARKTNLGDLCLSGGCALNCAANGALLRAGLFDRIFVQPASHDGGTALGSALAVHREITGKGARIPFGNAFLGPAFESRVIEDLLETSGWKGWKRVDDPGPEAARRLVRGEVVGWFQGRMEVGPRALGGRSILADPREKSVRDRVNRIKGREPWRPLAPTIIEEQAPAFLKERAASPFMLFAFHATEEAQDKIPAVVHVDGTVRAQILNGEAQPRFRDLLATFEELTGVGAVLNTSFNGAGEPIVCSPRDALQAFFSMGLDALVMEDYVVWK